MFPKLLIILIIEMMAFYGNINNMKLIKKYSEVAFMIYLSIKKMEDFVKTANAKQILKYGL